MHSDQKPTEQEFSKWRSPVRGTRNPERMNNPFWEWAIQTREIAYTANQAFNGPDALDAGPCWCFSRFGQAHVVLPDGRDVYIGGEHEDSYDPDFYIYNDVVIIDTDNEITIFGYPESSFPATDFHTATLVDQEIFIIGNLGYPEQRVHNRTQVLRLNIETWQMTPVPTTGTQPGWIHGHMAELSADQNAIIVTGGKICGERILESIDDYELCLTTLVWSKLTDRSWERWILARTDGRNNDLWDIRMAWRNREVGGWLHRDWDEYLSDLPAEVAAELKRPSFSDQQMDLIGTLYQSPFDDEPATKQDDGLAVYSIDVDGTTVRFNEERHEILVTVEGRLPAETVNALLSILRQKVSELENTSYDLVRLDPEAPAGT